MKISLIFTSIIITLNLVFSQSDCAKIDVDFSGFCSEYYSDGKTKWVKEFQDGEAVGIWMCFDEKGNLVKQLNVDFKRDSLNKIYEETFHIDLKDTIVYEFVDEEASFKGNMLEYVVKNLIVPEDYIDISYFSKVYISFVVEKNGQIFDVKIKKRAIDCLRCDLEIIRMVEKMPNWKPAILNNKIVRSKYILPLRICF